MLKGLLETLLRKKLTSLNTHVANIPNHADSPKLDHLLSPRQKAQKILEQMTLEEKIQMLAGTQYMGIHGVPRLRIRSLWCSDASSGVHNFGRCTAFPAAIAMAASWNRTLIQKVGDVIGEECRAKGVSVLLAPGVNIYRVPTNGRNFEYMGEDPYLASQMVVPYISGVQNRGVACTVKHFACNNSEYDRHKMDSRVSQRALHEIYFPAFKAAVQQAKVKGVMCAYNLLNGTHCSESHFLLTDILRDRWKFPGFVISDWNCLYSTEGPLLAGLDLEMPKPKYYTESKINALLHTISVNPTNLDDHVFRLLHMFFELGAYERENRDSRAIEFGNHHDDVAYQISAESIVLLKNANHLLPLSPDKEQTILVLGPLANNTPTMGGGSCYVHTEYALSIKEAIEELAGKEIKVKNFHASGRSYSRSQCELIQNADSIIYCAGYHPGQETEVRDKQWRLPGHQSTQIQTLAKLNPNIIVTLTTGGGCETESWIHQVPAVIHSFFLGQNAGWVVGETIFGGINPSGKLPFSMLRKWEDSLANRFYVKKPDTLRISRIVQITSSKNRTVSHPCYYEEEIFVGYRYLDHAAITPQFAFGHGLSYTEFEFANLQLSSNHITSMDPIHVELDLKNNGKIIGKEVVQLYIAESNPSVPRPPKELKGFVKIELNPQELQKISFTVSAEDLQFFDESLDQWTVNPGSYQILIGASSRDIKLSTEITYEKL